MSKMVLVNRMNHISKITEQEAKAKGYKIIPDDTPLVFYYSSYAVEVDEDPRDYAYGIVTESLWEDMCHDCYGGHYVDSYEEAKALQDEMDETVEKWVEERELEYQ